MQAIIDWVVGLMELLGAPGVGIAILLENLFPPIPSEVVLPLAGFTISQGSLNFLSTFLWATAGSVIGAWILYGVGAWLGAERLRKIADWMWLIESEDVDKALNWFDKYGPASVFFGRFIPGVRSLISIPAGIDRMPAWKFTLWTTAGSAGWNALLIGLGVWLGESYHLVERYVSQYSNVVYLLIVLAVVVVIVLLIRRQRNRKKASEGSSSDSESGSGSDSPAESAESAEPRS